MQARHVAHDELPQQTPSTQAPLAHSVDAAQFCPLGRPTHMLFVALHTGAVAGQLLVPLGQQLGSADGMQAVPQAL